MNVKLQAFFELRGMPNMSDSDRVAWIRDYVERFERENKTLHSDLMLCHQAVAAQLKQLKQRKERKEASHDMG